MRHERRARPATGEGAPKGERALGKAPRNRGKNTTLLASMGSEGMGACLAVEGPTTKAVFGAYVERVLAPSLSPGQVVVLDNLSAHKGGRARELVEERGARLLCSCPPTRPTSRPSRRHSASSRRCAAAGEGPYEGGPAPGDRGRALDAITPEDAKGWFGHCGYAVAQSL